MKTQDSGAAPAGTFAGLLMVAIGTVLLLDRFDVVEAGNLFRYWPLLLVAWGLTHVVQGHDRSTRAFGGIVCLAGVVLQANRLGLTDIGLRDLWPILLIAIGVALLWNTAFGPRAARTPPNENTVNGWTLFGGVNIRNTSKAFEGGDILSIFGGYQLDLRHAEMRGDETVLVVNAIFGGVELWIPEHWKAVLQGTPIFGGFEDKTVRLSSNSPVSQKTLYIRGTVVFGGVNVKN